VSVRGGSRRFIATVFGAVAAVASLSGCRADIATSITVSESGNGSISVVVTADADAARSAPELADSLNLDDLRDAGWDVSVQNPTPAGGLSVTLMHDFATPADGTALLARLAGPDGPYRDLALVRNGGLTSAVYEFSGNGGLPQGLAGFADDEALALLGGPPFAETLAASGLSLTDALGVSLRVTLPGAPNAPDTATLTSEDELTTTFEWTVPVDGSNVALAASTQDRNLSALIASIAADGLLVLIIVLAVAAVAYVGSVVYRRSRPTPGS
jgi:hypothetical protein